MANKIDISSFQIAASKMRADGTAYFKLFEKHIPRNLDMNSVVLLYKIDNMSCIYNIVNMNSKAHYVVVSNDAVNTALQVVLDKSIDVEYIKKFDFKKTDMKFDCIIMNPPYVRNLHLKILAEAIKHLKDEKSMCVNLSPITWAGKHNICQPKGEWRKKLNGKINSLDFIEHRNANDIFGTGNAIEDLAITTYKNNGTFDIINYGFTSQLEASLFKKINIFKKDGTIFTLSQATGKSAYGSGNGKNVIRKKYDVPIYTWHGGKTCGEAVLNTKV